MNEISYKEKRRLVWMTRVMMVIGALVSLGALAFAVHLFDVGMLYMGVGMAVVGAFGLAVSLIGYSGIVLKLKMM